MRMRIENENKNENETEEYKNVYHKQKVRNDLSLNKIGSFYIIKFQVPIYEFQNLMK